MTTQRMKRRNRRRCPLRQSSINSLFALTLTALVGIIPIAHAQGTITYEAPEEPKEVLIRTVKEPPPILKEIARCESGDQHTYEDGSVVIGKLTPAHLGQDIGRYQISTHYHGKRAKALGYDLWSEEGNEQYAILLYEEEGTGPWRASAGCWSL